MRRGRVAQLVDGVHDGVKGSIYPDAHIGAIDVIVDTGRRADDRDAPVGQNFCAVQAAIPARHDHRVDLGVVDLADGFALALRLAEFGAARGLQNGAAALEDTPHVASAQGTKIAVDQPLEPVFDPQNLDIVGQGGADYRPHKGVHAG